MHDKTSRKQAAYNQCMMIPVIVLSTLTGTANFGLDSLFSDPAHKKIASLSIGGFGILTGVISTLANFMRYAQGSEAHSVAAISWAKFSRHTSIELALHPNDRIEAFAFLKMFRIELDRLIEQSPPIPDDIIRAFEKEFEDLPSLKRPDIAHGMDHTQVFNNKEERAKKMIVDMVQMMKQKKKVWHEHMMPEVDKRLNKVMTDLSGSLFSSMQSKVKELEVVVKKQTEEVEKKGDMTASSGSRTIFRSFLRVPNLSRDPVKSEKIRDQMISSLVEDSKRDLEGMRSDIYDKV
jgi:hypothetical protein